MNCHSQIWLQSPYLEPVRESFRTDRSLEWTRVHDLPDFVYFDHSIHVNKGVGCETCHGRVDEMPLVWQAARLQMGWCLECHRHPEKFIRPREEVFTMGWQPPEGVNREEYGMALARQYRLRGRAVLESCSTCHR
jgi:Cytochrome c7 and related cytochrome c